MIQHVEAIYEHGVLRPLEPIPLAESQRVSVTISYATASDSVVSDSAAPQSLSDPGFLNAIRAEAAALRDIPSLEGSPAGHVENPGLPSSRISLPSVRIGN